MRILHIDTGREMRGGQWQALYLLEGLAAAGHECVLLTRPGSPLCRAARGKGFDVRALFAGLSWRADVVHAHDGRAHALAAFAARRPVVVSRRVAFPIRQGWASSWKYRRAAHFIAVSEAVRRALIAGGVEPSRISVVHDGVPPRPSAAGGDCIVAPFTEDPRKGSDLLREAARLGGFQVHSSQDLVRDLDSARVFVYITQDEGLGSAALLAMAAGVPVVASRVGGLPEVVEDGATGLLTDNTPPAIANAVNRLLADRDLAARLAACARSRVERDFSQEAMVRGTLRIYERVLGC